MERLGNQRPSGLSASALRTWGLIIAALGVVGKGILQNRLLNLQQSSMEQLLDMMSDPTMMTLATASIVMQIIETCAVPLFAFLTVEGFRNTSDFKKYLLRVCGIALLSELPYNFAMTGQLIDMNSRNPVFSVVLCLIVLHFFHRYDEKGFKNAAIKLMIIAAAFVWAEMLRIEFGAAMLLVTIALWLSRNKSGLRSLIGGGAAMICTVFSVCYMAAPMSFLAIHAYNDEKGEGNRAVQYFAYPAILLIVGLVGHFAL